MELCHASSVDDDDFAMMTYPDPKNGQMYYFAMNGENGKVCGVLPVDSKKLVRLFLTIFIPVFVLLLLGGYLI